MRFGGPLPWTGPLATPHNMLSASLTAERLGYDWVSAGEYLLYPRARPVPMPGGGFPVDPQHDEFELLTTFAWLAAQTSTLRFQTAMLILAYRSPFVVAKQIASIDRLSGGRLVLGVAAGWMRDEFEIFGIPFERRGAILDENLALVAALLDTGGPFEGERFTVPETWFEPRPSAGSLRVAIGGGSIEPVLRRVARHGHIWNPYGCGAEEIRAGIARLATLLEEEGRAADHVDVQTYLAVNLDPERGPVTSRDQLLRRVDRFAQTGITQLSVTVGELGGVGLAPPTMSLVLDTAAWVAEQLRGESAQAFGAAHS